MCRAHALVSFAITLAGCGGGELAEVSLRYLFATNPDGELATPPHPWAGYGCGTAAPDGAECVALRLSACTGDSCVPVIDGPGAGQDDSIVSLQNGTFELPTKTATRDDLFLEAGVYSSDGVLLATGEVQSATFPDGKEVPVTLIPVGAATACGDPDSDSAPLNVRAFHTATLLPNQEVLLVGGVSGPVVYTDNATPLEESMDVLDPRSGEHHRLEVVNQATGEPGGQLFRAFHQAAYVATEPGDRYRIRVFGGIRSPGASPSVIVSATRANTPLNLLVVGAASAQPAPPVDLLYDPGARTVTVTDAAQDAEQVPRASFGGLAALTDVVGSDTEPDKTSAGYYVGGGLGEWQEGRLDVGRVDAILGTFFVNQNGGTANASPPALRVGRVGTTAIGIGDDQVLFWGGNAWSAEGAATTEDAEAALAAEIGEVHRPREDALPAFVEADGALPIVSTAFHAAVVAAADADGTRRIVVAGGYPLTGLGTVAINELSPVPLYLLSFDPATSSAVASEIECLDRRDRPADCADVFGDVAYATATWIAEGQVLLVGGNFLFTQGELQTKYAARAVAGVVTVTGPDARFEPIDLATARYGHTATRLHGGAVLIYGGVSLGCDQVTGEAGCSKFGDLRPVQSDDIHEIYEIYNPGLAFAPEGTCEPVPAE